MKHSLLINSFSIAVMAMCLTLNVACSESSKSSHPGAAGANTGTTAGNFADGTTDGNGGNGVDGKMYESYIVDPTDLPAFKNIIKPKIELLISKIPRTGYEPNDPYKGLSEEGEAQMRKIYAKIFLSKKWYIAPVSLKSLNKKTIGVEFSQENTEQLALQTDSEVWIHADAFNKMSEMDQATLITHEFAMTIYMAALKGDPDYCAPYNLSDCAPIKNTLDKVDYQRIRAATNFILALNAASKYSDIMSALDAFNPRKDAMSSTYDSVPKPQDAPLDLMPSYTIMTILKSASASGALDGLCKARKMERQCSFQVSQIGQNELSLTVTDANSKEVLKTLKLKITDSYYSEYKKADTRKKFFSFFIDTMTGEPEDGQVSHRIGLLLGSWNDRPDSSSDIVSLSIGEVIWSATAGERDGKKCQDAVGVRSSDRQIILGSDLSFLTVDLGKSGYNSCATSSVNSNNEAK